MVEAYVGVAVVIHAARAVVLHPQVPVAMGDIAPGAVVVAPGAVVDLRGDDRAAAVLLLEDRTAVLESQCLFVVEAAYAWKRTEVVVDRAVLLHKDHDMPQVGHVA